MTFQVLKFSKIFTIFNDQKLYISHDCWNHNFQSLRIWIHCSIMRIRNTGFRSTLQKQMHVQVISSLTHFSCCPTCCQLVLCKVLMCLLRLDTTLNALSQRSHTKGLESLGIGSISVSQQLIIWCYFFHYLFDLFCGRLVKKGSM